MYIYNDIASCKMCQPFASMYSDDYLIIFYNYNIYIDSSTVTYVTSCRVPARYIFCPLSLSMSIYNYLCKYIYFLIPVSRSVTLQLPRSTSFSLQIVTRLRLENPRHAHQIGSSFQIFRVMNKANALKLQFFQSAN